MKILLSGLPSTGKTTLGKILSTALGIPLVREAAEDLASGGVNVGPSMSSETLSAITIVQMAREAMYTSDFVADRGPFDMLAYNRMLQKQAKSGTCNLINSAIETIANDWLHRAQYDLIVYHEILCGSRGTILQSRHPTYLLQLAACFESVINEQGFDVLRIPTELAIEGRWDLIINALRGSLKL